MPDLPDEPKIVYTVEPEKGRRLHVETAQRGFAQPDAVIYVASSTGAWLTREQVGDLVMALHPWAPPGMLVARALNIEFGKDHDDQPEAEDGVKMPGRAEGYVDPARVAAVERAVDILGAADGDADTWALAVIALARFLLGE